MKTVFTIATGLCLFLILSCDKAPTRGLNENCKFKETLMVPEGFELTLISDIPGDVHFKELQFINDEVGFALAESDLHGYVVLYKTENRGVSWKDLNLDYRTNPVNTLFINESTGFITYYGSKGRMYKTTDGGITWTEKIYDNLNGTLCHIRKDVDNNLYAVMNDVGKGTVLVKSTDTAESWQVINDSKESKFELNYFCLALFRDKIYMPGFDNNIIVTDLNGDKVEEIHTPNSRIRGFDIINNQEFVLTGTEGTFISSDHGLNWDTLHNGRVKIIDFENFDTGMFIYTKNSCPIDYTFNNDVIAYTIDGSFSWQESHEATNIKHHFVDSYKRSDGDVLILIENDLYKIKKL